jgi:hypothetical protein
MTDFEKNVMDDMKNQQDWARILNPTMSLLKFRTPYNFTGNLTYMSGKLLYGIWRPAKSTESRLLTHQKEINDNKEYNANSYEQNHFFHNKYIRPFSFRKAFQYPQVQTNQYCPCFDCYAELTILKEYESILSKTDSTYQNIDEVINMISTLYSNKFWSKTWDDNIPIEKQLDSFESKEPNNILGVKRTIQIQNKNILIVIPKFNIYGLENFETLFTEYIDDLYNKFADFTSKNTMNNMMYYKIVILEHLPFKDKNLYGALMNSAYTIAMYSQTQYHRILFHEPFLLPNRKLLELYLSDIPEDIIIYSNIYKPLHTLSVFSIKTEIFHNINGYPNNIDDVYLCNKICLERIKNSGNTIKYVSSNNIDSNSAYFNINYEDSIADIRPIELLTKLSNDTIENINNMRAKSNYDNWCGVKQKYYFNTHNITYHIHSIGDITDIIKYTIKLHNSCDIYNDINEDIQNITRLEDINREIINFIKRQLDKYLIDEGVVDESPNEELGITKTAQWSPIDENTISIEHTGKIMNYGEYLENILNVIEETFYFVNSLKSPDENIQNVIKMIINKWYSYLLINESETEQKNQRIKIIKLSDPSKLVVDPVYYSGLMKLNKIYMYSQHPVEKYLLVGLFPNSSKDIKLLYEYPRITYLNMIVHNMNILNVDKILNEFEQTIK